MSKFYIKDILTNEIKYPVTNTSSILDFDEKISDYIVNNNILKEINDWISEHEKKYDALDDSIKNISENMLTFVKQEDIKTEVKKSIEELNISDLNNEKLTELSKKIDDLSEKLNMIVEALLP